jgi:hypothetical protein
MSCVRLKKCYTLFMPNQSLAFTDPHLQNVKHPRVRRLRIWCKKCRLRFPVAGSLLCPVCVVGSPVEVILPMTALD